MAPEVPRKVRRSMAIGQDEAEVYRAMARSQTTLAEATKVSDPATARSTAAGRMRPSSASAGKVVMSARGMTAVKRNRQKPEKTDTGQRAASKMERNRKDRLSTLTTKKAADTTRIHSE